MRKALSYLVDICSVGHHLTRRTQSLAVALIVAQFAEAHGQLLVDDDAWQVGPEPRLEIGTPVDGRFALYRVAGASFLADGRIVVANDFSELLLFGPDGDFQRSFGREGDGPGEFKRIGAIGVGNSDTLLVFDRFHSRISVFDSDGELAGTTALDAGAPVGARMQAGPLAGGWTAQGRFVASRSIYELPRLAANSPRQVTPMDTIYTSRPTAAELFFFDAAGTVVSKVSDLMGTEKARLLEWETNVSSISLSSIQVDVSFLKTLEVAVASNVVAFGNTAKYEIRLLNSEGQEVATIRRPGEPSEVTETDRERWIEDRLTGIGDPKTRRSRRSLLETLELPTTVPQFRSLAIQEGGRIWVEEFRIPAEANGPSTWQVYDSAGAHLGEAVLPAGFRPFSITRDEVMGLWRDELDVEFIRVYELEGAAIG